MEINAISSCKHNVRRYIYVLIFPKPFNNHEFSLHVFTISLGINPIITWNNYHKIPMITIANVLIPSPGLTSGHKLLSRGLPLITVLISGHRGQNSSSPG